MTNIKKLSFESLSLPDAGPVFYTPVQILNKIGSLVKNVSIDFTMGDECFTNLLENIILEYKPNAGKEESYTTGGRDRWTYKNIYLKTYVSVGIPKGTYNCILKEVNQQFEEKVATIHNSTSNGYTWVTADICDINLQCIIHSRKPEATVSIGSPYNIMTQLKRNLRGYGYFDISILVLESTYFLKFSLKDFQLVDQTNLSSSYRPCIDVDISEDLKKKLDINE